MPRPVTLFTGQWADLPLETLAPLARKMGYDGLELACWGDHFDVDQALSSKKYRQQKWDLLRASGLTCHAISSHLVGQAICDPIDERLPSILPAGVWGNVIPRECASVRRGRCSSRDARPGPSMRPPTRSMAHWSTPG